MNLVFNFVSIFCASVIYILDLRNIQYIKTETNRDMQTN